MSRNWRATGGWLVGLLIFFGLLLFCGWAIYIGPWGFDEFLVDTLPWLHEYRTSMGSSEFLGHFVIFGFIALVGLGGIIGSIQELKKLGADGSQAP